MGIELLRKVMRGVATAGFTLAGLDHFWNAAFFDKIVPPMFPDPHLMVVISGVAEIAGGIGLQVPRLRRAAGWGLIALLIAVFPANVYMAVAPKDNPASAFPKWALWARLPLQAVFIAWVWWVMRPRVGSDSSDWLFSSIAR